MKSKCVRICDKKPQSVLVLNYNEDQLERLRLQLQEYVAGLSGMIDAIFLSDKRLRELGVKRNVRRSVLTGDYPS